MEFKKNIKNKYFIFYIITVFVCFLLGYVLLASLDHISHPTIEELYISIYTVFTQFGMLIFPVLVIQTFVMDYRGKNILFYKLMGYNWIRFFVSKFITVFFWFSFATVSGIVIISILYQNFTYTFPMIAYFESAIFYEILLSSMWGFLFKNVIGAYVINFVYWLFAMVASIANSNLSFLVRYDASNPVFSDLNRFLNTQNRAYLAISGNAIYSLLLFVIVLIIIFIFRRRWEKNGL